jgi:nucleoside-diphosphate-sugar epimerase
MDEIHVIVGAGPVGRSVARRLAAQGRTVRVVTRSGSGPELSGVERVAADASDSRVLAELTTGATAIYNCANPPYHRWPAEWPPIARSLLGAAEKSGAVLVTVANLYAYGPATESLGVPAYDERHPITEETPLATIGTKGGVRRQMWADALALHRAGRIRAVEVRSSDYVGPGAQSMLGDRAISPLLRGGSVWIPGRLDRLHTWTFIDDVARTITAAADDPGAWGRAWHTPSNEPRTIGDALDDLARRAGVRRPTVRTLPYPAMYALGFVSPLMYELRETQYQFRSDFVMDSSAAQRTLELAPTPWETVLDATLAPHLRSSAGELAKAE